MNRVKDRSSPCTVCGFPITEATISGETVKCPYCSTINTAITDVTIPTPVFAGVVAFAVGVFVGPALLAATQWGQDYLAKQVRKRM